MKKMKALVYCGKNKAELQEKDIPAATDNEVIIKIKSCGFCGSDVGIAIGKHPRAREGLVFGHELAGIIEQVGKNAHKYGLAKGEKVTANPLLFCGKCWACNNGLEHICDELRLVGIDIDGGMAEYVKVNAKSIFKIPQNMEYERASLIEPIAVGVHAVQMADLNKAEKSLIIGAGPIGLITALCLKNYGFESIVTDISEYRLSLAQNMGLTAINPLEKNIKKEIETFSSGYSLDAVFECAGSGSAVKQICEYVRPRGKIIIVSVHKEPRALDLRLVNFKEISIIGTRVYTKENYSEAIKLASDDTFLKIISHRLDLEQARKGLELVKQAKDVAKVIIKSGI